MSTVGRSLVRTPQGVRIGASPTGTAPAVAALARVASSAGRDEAVYALADELLDPIAGLAQGARALLSAASPPTNEFREEMLGLMYDRARELDDALVFYDRAIRPAESDIT